MLGTEGGGARDQGGGSCRIRARNELMGLGACSVHPGILVFWLSPWEHTINTPKAPAEGSQGPGGYPSGPPIILAK